MKKYVFGVDIGGTTVKLGLFDVEGNVLDKWEIPDYDYKQIQYLKAKRKRSMCLGLERENHSLAER